MPLGKCRLVATNKNTLIFGIVLGWSIHKDCMTQFQFGPSIIEVWQIWRFPKFGCPKSSNTRPLKYWKPWFWGSPIVGNLHIYILYTPKTSQGHHGPCWSMLVHGPPLTRLYFLLYESITRTFGKSEFSTFLAGGISGASWRIPWRKYWDMTWPCRMIDIKPVL
jgi:hypothetical protein